MVGDLVEEESKEPARSFIVGAAILSFRFSQFRNEVDVQRQTLVDGKLTDTSERLERATVAPHSASAYELDAAESIQTSSLESWSWGGDKEGSSCRFRRLW